MHCIASSGIQNTKLFQRFLDPGPRPVSRGLAGMTNCYTDSAGLGVRGKRTKE
jgi:hypothetical protein